jgi:hypothetical protein
MNTQTSKALWESIEHWLWNYNHPLKAFTSAEGCSLCRKFQVPSSNHGMTVIHCHGCPVYEKTGQHLCLGTPYTNVRHRIMDRYKIEFSTYQALVKDNLTNEYYNTLKESIRAEYEFLVSLLDTLP